MPGFLNDYPNLPGHLVEFRDGGMALRTDPNPPNTDSVLILGTAIDGPVMEPIAVDINTVEVIFGKAIKPNGVPNGSTLVRDFKQMWNSGCRDIRLMRTTGATAKLKLENPASGVNEEVAFQEDLGFVAGNEVTTINLKPNVETGSVKVFAKGVELLAGVTVVDLTGVLTIAKDTCDAGASLMISYDYKANVGDTEVIHATETGTAEGEPYVTATAAQDIALTNTPVAGSMHLYIDGAESLTSGAFTLTTADGVTTISIKKELFSMGAQISVSYYYAHAVTVKESVDLESYFGGALYNQGYASVTEIKNQSNEVIGKLVSIVRPDVKKSQVTQAPNTYSSLDYPTFEQLVSAINFDRTGGIYKASTGYPDALVENLPVTTLYFNGGEDGIGLGKDAMFKALSGERNAEGFLTKAGAYQLLEDYRVDWVVPGGVYADEALAGRYQSFAYELALFNAVLSFRSKTTLGAIAMKPPVDTGLAGIQDYAKKAASYNNVYLMRDMYGNLIKDAEGNAIDLGKFISVVCGPEPVCNDPSIGDFFGNPAIQYIGMNTGMQPQSAPTNKPVPGAKRLRFRFSNAQLDMLTANRLVTFKSEIGANGQETVLCVDGVTAARKGSDYARLTTFKVLRSVVDQVRLVSNPFIGEPNTVEQKNALASAISKRLGILKERGVIVDFGFVVVITPQDQVLGQASIELWIVAPQEMRKITTVVGLRTTM